jgi:ribosomal protein L11 methyltransferase
MLDPGLAFGTGTHPTTALCLTWLEHTNIHHKTLIDYGCGSGILALAALKLGASHVDAVDIDEQALTATMNNANANSLDMSTLNVAYPETLIVPVDIVLANILLTPLIALKARFKCLLKPQGTLVVSGLLETQMDTVIEAYSDIATLSGKASLDGWGLLAFSSNTP